MRLLVAYVDHATEAAAAARQCLSVFFPAYTAFCGWHQRLLCEATLPAARRALGLGPSPAKSVAPSLLRFVLQLLQVASSVTRPKGRPCVQFPVDLCIATFHQNSGVSPCLCFA